VIVLQHVDRTPGAVFPKGTLYELVPGEKGTFILRPVQPAAPGGSRPEPNRFAPVVPPGKPGASGADLEKRLDTILLELEQLRKEMRSKPPSKLDNKPEEEIRLKLQSALKEAELLYKQKLDLEAQAAEALLPLRVETDALQDKLKLTDREVEDAHVHLKALEADFEAALQKVAEQGKPDLVKRFADQRDKAHVRAEEAQRVRAVLREKSEQLKLKTDAIGRDRDAALRKIEQELKLAEEAASRARKALDELPSRP
jgi:hypothetical protein